MKDTHEEQDKLGTWSEQHVANGRERVGNLPIYVMGQPTSQHIQEIVEHLKIEGSEVTLNHEYI